MYPATALEHILTNPVKAYMIVHVYGDMLVEHHSWQKLRPDINVRTMDKQLPAKAHRQTPSEEGFRVYDSKASAQEQVIWTGWEDEVSEHPMKKRFVASVEISGTLQQRDKNIYHAQFVRILSVENILTLANPMQLIKDYGLLLKDDISDTQPFVNFQALTFDTVSPPLPTKQLARILEYQRAKRRQSRLPLALAIVAAIGFSTLFIPTHHSFLPSALYLFVSIWSLTLFGIMGIYQFIHIDDEALLMDANALIGPSEFNVFYFQSALITSLFVLLAVTSSASTNQCITVAGIWITTVMIYVLRGKIQRFIVSKTYPTAHR